MKCELCFESGSRGSGKRGGGTAPPAGRGHLEGIKGRLRLTAYSVRLRALLLARCWASVWSGHGLAAVPRDVPGWDPGRDPCLAAGCGVTGSAGPILPLHQWCEGHEDPTAGLGIGADALLPREVCDALGAVRAQGDGPWPAEQARRGARGQAGGHAGVDESQRVSAFFPAGTQLSEGMSRTPRAASCGSDPAPLACPSPGAVSGRFRHKRRGAARSDGTMPLTHSSKKGGGDGRSTAQVGRAQRLPGPRSSPLFFFLALSSWHKRAPSPLQLRAAVFARVHLS